MKATKFILLALCLLISPARAQYGLQIDTNATIVRGTNFFNANWNLWLPLLQQYISTNPPAGGAGITNFSLSASSVSSTSAPSAVVTGTTNGIAYIAFNIPAGAAGTNTVNYYNLSNAIVSSQTYQITNSFFNFAYSNYLGVFTNVYKVSAAGPSVSSGSMAPPSSAVVGVFYSTNSATNGWQYAGASGLPAAPNYMWLAVTSSGTGAGNVKISGIIHGEALGRTNYLNGQLMVIDDAIQANSPVSLGQMLTAIANATTGWQSSGSNYYFAPSGIRLLEATPPAMIYSTNLAIAIDATGTNFSVTIPTTNFVAGWQFQMSTNLALINGFGIFGGYTLTTNSGIATFTIPVSVVSPNFAFFRIVSPQVGQAQSDYPFYCMSPTTNCLVLADTNKTGHLLGLYASTNASGTPTLYIHGSGTSRLLGDRDENWLLWLLTGCSLTVAVFSVAHTRWHVRRHHRKHFGGR